MRKKQKEIRLGTDCAAQMGLFEIDISLTDQTDVNPEKGHLRSKTCTRLFTICSVEGEGIE